MLNVANRHPAVLANMAATLQEVSGGRLILGIGAGGSRETPYATEQLATGRPVPGDRTRAAQVAEALQVIQRLWQGDSSSFEGKHFQLDRPTGFLPAEPPPPLIVGGFGPRMAAIAGRHADGFNTQAGHPALQKLIETAKRERAAAGRANQPFEVSVFAGLSERWLRPSADRQRLASLGVTRLILLVDPPFDVEQIREAGKLLE